MEWYTAFSLLMASFFVFVLLGIPVVFAFFGTNVIFLVYFMGFAGFKLLIDSVYGSLSVFVLLPITMFILQGEILFRTGLVTRMIDALDSWLGSVPAGWRCLPSVLALSWHLYRAPASAQLRCSREPWPPRCKSAVTAKR